MSKLQTTPKLERALRKNYFFPVFCTYLLGLSAAHAAVGIKDTLTGASSSYDWQSLGAACLTAGNNTGSIPACVGRTDQDLAGGATGYLPDVVGSGALRLTSNRRSTVGAVYSKFSFPSNAGVNITFKTVTYGGDGASVGDGLKSGADGIVFFLTDADKMPSSAINASTNLGGLGGSMGYSCSNDYTFNNDGIYAAYLGLGIDEWGNFTNHAITAFDGPGINSNTVTLRGAGDINFKGLNEKYPKYYPASVLNTKALQDAAVRRTCQNAKLFDHSTNANGVALPITSYDYASLYGYRAIVSKTIMDTQKTLSDDSPDPADTIVERKKRRAIFSQQGLIAPVRSKATPITYNIKITSEGLLSLNYSYNGGEIVNVLNKQDISASNGPMPKNFHFGFTAGTGGATNIHEIMCFKAEAETAADSSSAGNVPPQGRVQVGSQVYIAAYHPKNWWGQLTAQSLVLGNNDSVTLSTTANWDASCNLTSSGACESTSKSSNPDFQSPGSRKLFTWSGAEGKSLIYENLTSEQQTALGSGTNAIHATNVAEWLRGDRSKELANGGDLRTRDSVLGDIVSSSPTWVGSPQSPYKGNWVDMLYSSAATPETVTAANNYTAFATSNAQRTNMVYVGANDGMLHGFRAGVIKADGSFDATINDGKELLGYMPDLALRTINNISNSELAFPSIDYGHNAFVDTTPGTGDLFVQGQWRTWLAGGLGQGGNMGGVVSDDTTVAKGALYVLDVTNPDSFDASKVIGEWNSDNLTCVNDTPSNRCKDSLGSTMDTPLLRRLHDGNWAILFGNGINSKTGKSGMFVMTIKQSDGSKTVRFIEAGQPQTNAGGVIIKRNGISQLTSADLDGDHITDYVYAGDSLGGVWRFDMTAQTPSTWSDDASKSLIFNAGQPITTGIAVSSTTKNEIYRVMLNFGTGKFYPKTLSSPSHVANGDHYLYGIWDSGMAGWNSISSVPYSATTGASTVIASELQEQTITDHTYTDAELKISGVRTVSQNKVCWQDSTTCASGNDKRGWKMKLTGKNEQVLYSPILSNGLVMFSTTIPEVTEVLSCDTEAAQGYTMAISPDGGTTLTKSYFKDAPNTFGVVAGIGTSGTGAYTIVQTGTRTFGVTQTTSGSPKTFELDPTANAIAKRTTWIKRR